MDIDPALSVRNGERVEATCWECGEQASCIEYIVCCTGTMFHVCPDCLEKLETDPEHAAECKDVQIGSREG